MVRRFIGGQLFDVLLDGTSIPITSDVPPRKVPIMILRELVSVADVVEQFMAALVLPFAPVGTITLPPSNIPTVTPDEGTPTGGDQPSQPTQPTGGSGGGGGTVSGGLGTPIYTRYGVPPDDLTAGIQTYWPEDQWKNAAEVSYSESGWRNTAINDTVSVYGPCGTRYFISRLGIWAQTEISIGYFQINICAHGGTVDMWEDGMNNCRKGAELYRSAGNKYTPWVITASGLGLPV